MKMIYLYYLIIMDEWIDINKVMVFGFFDGVYLGY